MNIKISNKLESINYINKFKLNKFADCLFKENESDKVLKFLSDNNVKYYALRDKSRVKSNYFNLKVKKEDILNEIQNLKLFTLNVSSYNYKENQLLVGEILLKSDGSIYLLASKNKDFSLRDVEINPDYNLNTDINDKKLKYIIGLKEIINYIINKKLEDIIVEFTVFDTEVGINNEKVIIWELRTNY